MDKYIHGIRFHKPTDGDSPPEWSYEVEDHDEFGEFLRTNIPEDECSREGWGSVIPVVFEGMANHLSDAQISRNVINSGALDNVDMVDFLKDELS